MDISYRSTEERIQALEKKVEELQKKVGIPQEATFSLSSNSKKKTFNPMPWMSLLFLIIPIIAYWGFSSGLQGNFSSQSTLLGNWAFKAKACRSGAAYIPPFWGVTIKSGKIGSPHFEVQGDTPQNAKILVWGSESENPVTLDRTICKLLDLKLKRNGSLVNNVVAVEGYLKMDCTPPGGGQFLADIQFRNCH